MATVAAVLDAVRAAEAAGANPAAVRDAALSAAATAAPPAPPATAYRARDGDVLDAVAVALYGDELAVLDLLAANAALAPHPPHLVAGTLVGVPRLTTHPPERRAVQLWD